MGFSVEIASLTLAMTSEPLGACWLARQRDVASMFADACMGVGVEILSLHFVSLQNDVKGLILEIASLRPGSFAALEDDAVFAPE